MMRWFFSILKTVIQTVIVCLVSLATTWYAVHLYVDEILDQFHISTPEQKLQLSKMISAISLQAGWNKNNNVIPAQPEQELVSEFGNDSGQTSTEPSNSLEEESRTIFDQPTIPAWSQKKEDALIISADEFVTKKDLLTDEEKWRIFEIVLQLPQNEMIRLSEMIEDGITEKEMGEIDSIFKLYVNQEEYDELMSMISKY